MTKVSILSRGLKPQEINDLRALLAESGVCEESAELLQMISDLPPDDDEVVILLGTSTTCLDGDLEADLVRSQASAQRVIWVWPKESTEVELPAAAKKYCYSVVPWNAKKLGETIADDDVICFEKADGTPLAKVETERNICVDDDKVKPT